MDFTVGIISRNLATTSNFVEFRDSRKFHVFRGNMCSAGHLAHFECINNLSSSVGPTWTHGMMPLEKNPKWVDKRIRCNPLNQ